MKKTTLCVLVTGLFLLSACNQVITQKEMSEIEQEGYDISQLTPLQYYVTQQEGTEPPFANKYWNNKDEGIYVSIVSGEPLFSSTDKYDSKTGWPSFTQPLEGASYTTHEDTKLGYKRVEMKAGDGAHLGHVFDDGPADKGGLRYCMNSASLKFIPKSELEANGLEEYVSLFENTTEN